MRLIQVERYPMMFYCKTCSLSCLARGYQLFHHFGRFHGRSCWVIWVIRPPNAALLIGSNDLLGMGQIPNEHQVTA